MKLYKYKSLKDFDFFLDIVINERLYCSEYHQLNDPFEGVFFTILRPMIATIRPVPLNTIKKRKTILDLPFNTNSKVCSLSSSLEDIRLWSYYADGHKGVVIEIDFTGIESQVVEVIYSDKIKNFGTTLLGGASADEVLSYKSHHWRFENEYRVIHKESYFSISKRISAIYAGARIAQEHLGLLRKCVPANIPVYETEIDLESISVIKK